MARANLKGIMEARRAFARIPEATRNAINEVNALTAHAIVSRAKARVARRSGLLQKSINWSQDKRRGTAKVGIEKGPAFYGHFVEFGTITQPARPFMLPATELERSNHELRFRDAGRRLERDVASVGGRFV